MLVPSLTFLNHFTVTKLSKSVTPLKDGLLALVLKVSFIVHLRESSLSCDSNFGILAKQSRQFTALSESETSLKAHVFSKKSSHSLDISRNGTRKNCIRSTHYIPSSRAGIHPFYLANDCTFPLDFCSVDWRNPVARSQIENDGVTCSISFPVRWSKLIWLKKKGFIIN